MEFNTIAPYYDTLSRMVFGNTLEKAKVSLYDHIKNGSTILFIGGGSGSSLQALLKLRKNLTIDFVESSGKMISKAKNRAKNTSVVNFYHKPVEEFEGLNYDYVITEFFLDLFEEPKIKDLIEIISFKLANNGKWIDTDFRQPSKYKGKFILKLMYWFFNIIANVASTKLVCAKPLLQTAGFDICLEKESKSKYISSRLITTL